MKNTPFNQFKKLIRSKKNVVIVTHYNPDGDAIGSSLALYHYLKLSIKNVKVIVPNASPDFLHWMPGNSSIINFEANKKKSEVLISKADLIFTLDFNSLKRLEELGDVVSKSTAEKVLIDHHQQPENYPNYSLHNVNACSTAELVYEFIVGVGGKKQIEKKIAACLYTGIMTDTGSFRYPSVNSNTHYIVSELLKTGIKAHEIHNHVYDSYSLNRIRLLGFALSQKLQIVQGLPVAYFMLNEKEVANFDFKKGDLEGVVNYPFSIKGIKVCALFHQTKDLIKISFRSKDKIDVNKFARQFFSGGGHQHAAGGKSLETLEETELKFLSAIKTLF